MALGDVMLRAMDRERTLRISLAKTTALVEEAHTRQNATPTASAALGRTLTAAVMMGLDLKDEGSVTLRINGGGPLGTILAVAESDGTVRGYVENPGIDVAEKTRGKLDVGGAVGTNGFLEVVRDMGMKSPFTGRVPLVSGEIAEDLAYYFSLSEQIPSLVSLGVLIEPGNTVSGAGGLFVQAMPEAGNKLLETIEKQALALGPISHLIKDLKMITILEKIMADIPFDIIDEKEVAFNCRCNLGKVVSIMLALEEEDIQKALELQGFLEVYCNFCGEVYNISEKQIELLRKQHIES